MRLAAAFALAGALLAVTSCRLTRDPATVGADSAAAAPRAPTSAGQDVGGAASYRLTMYKVDQWDAALRNIFVKMKDLPEAERDAMKVNVTNQSVDQITATLESQPVASSAIRDAGLSVREFALIYQTLFGSMMAVAELGFRPNENPDSLLRKMGVSMENVRFIQQNDAELTRKVEALGDEIARLGIR